MQPWDFNWIGFDFVRTMSGLIFYVSSLTSRQPNHPTCTDKINTNETIKYIEVWKTTRNN